MTGFLLDTNVISEASKARPHAPVLDFLRTARPDRLYLSVLTMGELRRGVYKLAARSPEPPVKMQAWVETIESVYGRRLLDVDVKVTERWARFCAERDRPVMDALLAATASVHGLTMVTRNAKDFQDFGLLLLNPWE